jgi:hypothetical protein
MPIMHSFGMACVMAIRTVDRIGGIQATGTIIEIRKKENRGRALLAGNGDIPFPILGLDNCGKHFSLLSNENVEQVETRTVTTKSGEQVGTSSELPEFPLTPISLL